MAIDKKKFQDKKQHYSFRLRDSVIEKLDKICKDVGKGVKRTPIIEELIEEEYKALRRRKQKK